MTKEQDLSIKQLNNFILERNFEEAAKIILHEIQPAQVTRVLHQLTEQGLGLMSYTFINYMIQQEPVAFWHKVAACLASESLDKISRGHNAGLYHILLAVELAPQDWSLKEYALGFYQEGLLDLSKARQFALEILAHEPDNKLALKILSE